MEKNEQLTVTLTGRRPVKIEKNDWPVLAAATDKEIDNQYEFQANSISKWALRVRQHDDGRAIVYAVYSYSSVFQGERNYSVRGGEMVGADSDLPAMIRRVGEWAAAQEHSGDDAARWAALIRECIADLPAEEL